MINITIDFIFILTKFRESSLTYSLWCIVQPYANYTLNETFLLRNYWSQEHISITFRFIASPPFHIAQKKPKFTSHCYHFSGLCAKIINIGFNHKARQTRKNKENNLSNSLSISYSFSYIYKLNVSRCLPTRYLLFIH